MNTESTSSVLSVQDDTAQGDVEAQEGKPKSNLGATEPPRRSNDGINQKRWVQV